MRAKVNSNQANQTASAVCTSPQTSTTIRVIDIGQPTSQVSPTVSESGSHISPGVNGVIVSNVSACNNVNNTNTIATSCIENVSAQSETSVDTSQHNELSLPKFSDSSKQVAVHCSRKLDEYFTLKKTPEELRLPLVFRSISDPFAKHWMLTIYGQLKSYDDLRRLSRSYFGTEPDSQKLGAGCIKTDITTGRGESLSEHCVRYANMASMLSSAMFDQDLLGAMITHYEPRIQNCLISANLKST